MRLAQVPLLLALVFCAAVADFGNESPANYDGYKVFRVPTEGALETILEKLAPFSIEPWNENVYQHIDFALPPDKLADFEGLGLDYTVMHEDLGANIAARGKNANITARDKDDIIDGSHTWDENSWFDDFHPYDDHVQFLHNLTRYMAVEIVTIGQSVQSRPITGLHLFSPWKGRGHPAMIFYGTLDARDRMSSMALEYLALQLSRRYSPQAWAPAEKAVRDNFDVYIFPIVNPDGFVYSHEIDPLWKKNRSLPPPGSKCAGVHLDRNWPYMWKDNWDSSDDPCASNYRGRSAASTPEIQALIKHIDEVRANQGITLFTEISFYGQHILRPYGFSCNATAPNHDRANCLAIRTGKRMDVLGNSRWKPGSTCKSLNRTSGSSQDYFADVAGAEYSLKITMRDHDSTGFVFPARAIISNMKELFTGLQYLLLGAGRLPAWDCSKYHPNDEYCIHNKAIGMCPG